MGSLTWKSGGGLWNDPGAWSIVSGVDTFPQAGDDALIAAPLNYAVAVNGNQAAHDVTLDASGAHLEIAGTLSAHGLGIAAGTVDVAGVLAVDGTIALSGGSLAMAGNAVLQGGTVTTPGGIFGVPGGTFDGVTVFGTLDESSATLNVTGGLTVLGPAGTGRGTLMTASGNAGTYSFLDSETLDNVNIVSGGMTIAAAAGTTLTLGPNVTVQPIVGNLVTFTGPGALTNYGSISAGGDAGVVLPFTTSVFDNEGTVTAASSLQGINVANDFINNGTYVGDGLTVGGTISGHGTVTVNAISAGVIEAGVHIARNGSTLGMTVDEISPQATIEGFVAGGAIDLTGVAYTFNTNVFWSGTPSGGTLTVMDGATVTAQLHLVGIQDGATFSVASDENPDPGVVIHTTNVPCFVAGTLISVPSGEVAVERLRVGDPVRSAFGGVVPVVWLGHRRVETWRYRTPETVWPIRICAGALGDGVPARDLLVSPEHALFIEGRLVPAGLLVDGGLVRRERRTVVEYWHVELPQHDVLLAEGAACESYLDVGNRADFGGAVVTARPDFGASMDEIWRARSCAPQCREGAALEAIRAAIARRGYERSAAPGASGTGQTRVMNVK